MRHYARFAVPIVFSVAASAASADSISWNGDVVEGNSWSTSFIAASITGIDFIGVRANSGNTFEAPAFLEFSRSGWENYGDYGEFPTIAAAHGPSTHLMTFRLHFAGDSPDVMNFDVVYFDGDQVRSVFRLDWDGHHFSIDIDLFHYDLSRADFEAAGTPNGIPLPSAAGLAGVGLMLTATRRRRAGV